MAGHTHGPTSGGKLWISLIVTLLFAAGEAGAGWWAHSLALLSDAGHNFTDSLALALAAYALWSAARPATASHTYGYHRVAILTALFNAVTLIVIALFIGVESFQRFLHPEPVTGKLMIVVAAIAVVMNTVIAAALSGDAKNSLNSRAAFIHMLGDALSSLAVVIAGIVVYYTHWIYAAPLVSALIAAFILWSAWGIVQDATDVLMERAPRGLDVPALVARIKSIAPVCGVHDLHIWTVGDGLNFLSCHIALPVACSLDECADLLDRLNGVLHDEFGIGHATIQTEVAGAACKAGSAELCCTLEVHAHGAHQH